MKIVAQNRRARYDYEITDTIEVGIMLTGQEVKSCRAGLMNLAGAYVSLLNGLPVLKQSTISPYSHSSNNEGYDPKRDRKLLMHKKQIIRLEADLQQKGISVIPLHVKAGKHIKVELALGKGKKRIDKRQKIKERSVERRSRHGDEY